MWLFYFKNAVGTTLSQLGLIGCLYFEICSHSEEIKLKGSFVMTSEINIVFNMCRFEVPWKAVK